jgi:hypothetical protein
MPDHDEGHADGPTIEVTAKRPNNTLSADGGGGGFYNFGGGHDAFHFTNPFFADGGGDGGGGGSAPNPPPNPPEDEGPEIVVPGERPDEPEPLTNREFNDAIRTILDNLDRTDFGPYRLEWGVGVAQLTIYDESTLTFDTYILTTRGGSVFSEPDPQPELFNLPPGFRPSGPDVGFGFDGEYF